MFDSYVTVWSRALLEVFFRKENVVELLTTLNADPTIRDNVHDLTPLDYAIGQVHPIMFYF